ncbi:hypothetical protein [Bacillus sp. V2I10]|uniref:hypothetical protein n=1 Tax=Bacillus sp. V2I10 TaxID=3042276 RepID=UPI002787D20E|nr:hypothetical protein [Bacillus sp. V2I10]MDQ0859904.1 hypothetical protein [Bacillus sp. V2I10]
MSTMLICIPSYSRIGCLEGIDPEVSSLAFITGDYSVQSHLKKRGFKDIYFIKQNAQYLLIHLPVTRVLLLEDKIADTCNLIQILQASIRAPITVITRNSHYPTKLYELIGAKQVLYSKQDHLGYFLNQ